MKKNLLNQFIKTRCEIVVDEDKMTKVLKVLNRHHIDSNLSIGDCEWKEANKWYVGFNATSTRMSKIEDELKEGEFGEILILRNTTYWSNIQKLGS